MAPRSSTSNRKKRVSSSDSDSSSSSSSSGHPSANKKQKKDNTTQKKATQSKAKGKKKATQAATSDDDDDDSASDQDGVGTTGKKGALSERDRKELVATMTRQVLFASYTRKVHTRKGLTEGVLTSPHTKKHFNSVIPGVQKLLRETWGMELVKMRAKEGKGGAGKNPSSSSYILRSTLPLPLIRSSTQLLLPALSSSSSSSSSGAQGSGSKLAQELAAWEADADFHDGARGGGQGKGGEGKGAPMRDPKTEQSGLYGLLGVILGLVLVNGKVLEDDQLISSLRRLSLSPSSPLPSSLSPPLLCTTSQPLTLSKYIDTLVSLAYLERGASAEAGEGKGKGRMGQTQRTQRGEGAQRVEGGDPGVEYRWGSRAEIEIGEKGIAEFMRLIYYASDQPSSSASEEEDEPAAKNDKGKGKDDSSEKKKKKKEWTALIARAAGTAQLEDADEVKVTL